MAISRQAKIGLALGAGLTTLSGVMALRSYAKRRKKNSKRKSRNRSSHPKRRYSYKKKQKRPYTAGKHRDTSHRRIRYTKNNQPYVIMANGRARFISKKSARTSRKRQGGRY